MTIRTTDSNSSTSELVGASTAASNQSIPGGVRAGAAILVEALGLLRREKSLWPLAAAPALLAVLAVSGATTLVYQHAGAINSAIAGWLPWVEAGAWYSWLWVAPAQLSLWLAGHLLFLFASAAAVMTAFLAANVLASPFLELLSQKVERLETGECRESGRGMLADAATALSNELRRFAFFAAFSIGLAVAGLIPGAQLLAPFIFAAFTMLFLPLEYCGAALDRRGITFAQRRRWIAAHRPLMLGFGATAFVTFLVPGLNFLMIPTLVTAGTLLTIRIGPPDAAP